MKKYISAILIPCLLLHLSGCYSTKSIQLEQMERQDELTIATKDSSEYNLVQNIDKNKVLNNPGIYYSKEWLINTKTESINMKTFQATKYFNQIEGMQINEEDKKISYAEISNVEIEEFDLGDTLLLTGIGVVSVAALIFLIGLSQFSSSWH